MGSSVRATGQVSKRRFTPEQIPAALRQAEGGTLVADAIRKLGITETTCYWWRKKCAGPDVGELRKLKTLREENAKLRQVVADLVLDKRILKDARGRMVSPRVRSAPPCPGGGGA